MSQTRTSTTVERKGYATCDAITCPSAGEHRPIALIEETTAFYFDGLPSIERTTTNTRPADDGDLACPDCGAPRSVAEHLPPVLEHLAPTVAD